MQSSSYKIRKANILPVLFFIATVLFVASSCDDIFEKDLEGKEVVIVSPADMLKTQYSTQTFWWEEMDGASSYKLQIVSPTFDRVEKVLVDSSITTNKIEITLYPGKFQWRIQPVNSSSTGKYTVRSLEIDTTLDLQGQQVVLTSPGADFATQKTQIKFKWNKLYNADDYRFELKSGSWEGSKVIDPFLTQNDTITIGSLTDDVYFWGVQAQNSSSASLYSYRKFYVDNKAPKTPVLKEPADSTEVSSGQTNMKWTSYTDEGSPVYDSLVIATDKNFKAGSIKFSEKVQGNSITHDFKDNGNYYWKVITLDNAGNVSDPSEIFLVKVSSTSSK
jgi:hypothetical protein